MAIELDRRRVVVVGAGKSGVAVAEFCASRGALVTLNDQRAASELPPPPVGVAALYGDHPTALFAAADLIVLSPGVPKLAAIDAARAAGVPITGEIELASQFVGAPILGVTGTNGKSTVTALTGAMLEQNGKPTFVGGNLGTPLATAIDTAATREGGQVVVELSSYQLETCETFHPRGAVLLNLTPDHLDRYGTMAAYGNAKLRIAQRMQNAANEVVVINGDDPFFAAAADHELKALRVLKFGDGWPRSDGFIDGGDLVLRLDREERYSIASMQIVGRHNCLNALAALLLVRGTNLCTPAEAQSGLSQFRALPHRMQLVGEQRGVRYYDDSKATNVDSVVAGVEGFPVPFVLIAGGRDKGGSYEPLIAALLRGQCRAVIAIGEAAPLIESAVAGRLPLEHETTLEAAVARGAAITQPGDAVILSPACSSFDMFKNYEHRGRVFVAAVEGLSK